MNTKILLDITHVAEFNFFKNAIERMESFAEIDVIIRSRGQLAQIMDREFGKNKYDQIGKHYATIYGKLFGLIYRNIEVISYCHGKNYDLYTGFGSFYASFASRFYRKPSVLFPDDYEYKLTYNLCKYSSDYLVIPDSIPSTGNVLKYRGFKELAYLHPNYFSPNEKVLDYYNLEPNEYVFIREISKRSLNYKDLDQIDLPTIIRSIYEAGLKAVVSLEDKNAYTKLENCIIIDKPVDVFSLMHFALFSISSGDSMARESCLVGTPSIYTGERDMVVNKEFINKSCMFKVNNLSDLNNTVQNIINKNIKKETKRIIEKSIKYEWMDTTEVIVDVLEAIAKKNEYALEKYTLG